jgi:hypothetical protein
MMIPNRIDAWELFLDHCADHDLDPEQLDFDQWCEDQWEASQEAAAERFQAHMEELAMMGREGWL